MTKIHTVRIDYEDRESAEKAFDRLDHVDWIMTEGGTLSLSSTAEVCAEDFDRIVAEHEAQTGGGDAAEQAREIADRVWVYDKPLVVKYIEAALRSSHRDGAEEARQDALRVPFTKALVAEARMQGRREGAEAMRAKLRDGDYRERCAKGR